MENELWEKQAFLRTNILERGCDAEQFMTFLRSKKGDLGLDLNNWTLNELTLAVQEFNSNNNNLNSAPGIQENTINNNLNQKEGENNKIQNDQDEYIPCEKIIPNELTINNDVDIKLSFPEKVEGGLFSKSYVTYLIQTSPMGYKIRKRYSDFEWLRNILSTIYINCVIPPFCKKNYADRFSEVLISKRTRSIEKFMKGILIHPIMKNSCVFYDFISMEKEGDFEKKKKEYNRLTAPAGLNQVKTLTGELKVTISKEKEIYLENIKDNADLNENILQKITKSYKELITQMEEMTEKMKELAELWKQLYKKNIKYYEKENTSASFNIMSKVMLDWSEINRKQKILLNEGIREYFRYIKNEFHGIKDLSQKVDNSKSIYMKGFEKLMAQKESVFKQDISTWGLDPPEMENKLQLLSNKNLAFAKMLPQETKKVEELRQYYGFYLNSLISEFERIRDLNAKRHKKNITTFIENINDSLYELQTSLTDRAAIYDEIEESEENDNENINVNKEQNDLNNNKNEEGNNNVNDNAN